MLNSSKLFALLFIDSLNNYSLIPVARIPPFADIDIHFSGVLIPNSFRGFYSVEKMLDF